MPAISRQKQQLRQKMRQLRQARAANASQQDIDSVWNHLTTMAGWQQVEHVAAYLAFDGEFPTQQIVERIIAEKGCCFLPRIVSKEHRQMEFIRCNDLQTLVANRWGILEPDNNLPTVDVSLLQWVLVPLVAVDRSGYRLGMGGGFYDRYFARKQRPRMLGLAWDEQIIEQVPVEPWDQPLHAVISERRVLCFKPNLK